MKKYYYQEGKCSLYGVHSKNPIVYESETDTDLTYKRGQLVCEAVLQGKCDFVDNCPVLLDAPEVLEDDESNTVLLENKL